MPNNSATKTTKRMETAQEAFYWLSRKRHAGYDRSELPQIPYDKEEFVIDVLDLNKRRVFARDIKPAQKHILKSKVIDKIDTDQHKRKYVISKDWYLVDGHHSWATCIPENNAIDVYQSDLDIHDLVRTLKDDLGYGSKDIKDKPINEDFVDVGGTGVDPTATDYCNPTYQRILKLYNSVHAVDKNRAKSLFQFMGRRHNEPVKDFCKRTDMKSLGRLEFELKNLYRLNEDLSYSTDIYGAIQKEIDTQFEGFFKHENRHDMRYSTIPELQAVNSDLIEVARLYNTNVPFNPHDINNRFSVHFAEYIIDHLHAGNEYTYAVGTPETHVMIYDAQKKLYYDAVHPWGSEIENLYYPTDWLKTLGLKYDPLDYMQ